MKCFREVRVDLDRSARSDVVAVDFDDRGSTSIIKHIAHDSFQCAVGVVDDGCWFVDDFDLLVPGDEKEGGNRVRINGFEVGLGPLDLTQLISKLDGYPILAAR
jgi:hypothetical protein